MTFRTLTGNWVGRGAIQNGPSPPSKTTSTSTTKIQTLPPDYTGTKRPRKSRTRDDQREKLHQIHEAIVNEYIAVTEDDMPKQYKLSPFIIVVAIAFLAIGAARIARRQGNKRRLTFARNPWSCLTVRPSRPG